MVQLSCSASDLRYECPMPEGKESRDITSRRLGVIYGTKSSYDYTVLIYLVLYVECDVDELWITPAEESKSRVVLSAIAFGLGINLPDVEHVFHWGPSADIMT